MTYSKFTLGYWEYDFDIMLATHNTSHEVRRLKIGIDGCMLMEDRLEKATVFIYVRDSINTAYSNYVTDKFLSD